MLPVDNPMREPMDMPDYKLNVPLPTDPKLRRVIETGRADAYVESLRKFVETNLDLVAEEAAVAKTRAGERVANAHFGNCVDKALAGMNISVESFCPAPPRRLTRNEVRYMVECECGDGSVRDRSCIQDVDTKTCRFEITEE